MPLAVGAGPPPSTPEQSVGLERGLAHHSREKRKDENTSLYTLQEWELMGKPGTRPNRDKPTIN